jgi:Trk K+ transport system NAD-binding subunit
MKRNMLIGCIIRDFATIIPRGDDMIKPGDAVLVAVVGRQIARLEDIFAS